MQYMLVMERRPKDYMPFDYDKLSQYENENLNTLEGIDHFTSKFNDEEDLKEKLLQANFIEENEFNSKMKIVFKENNGIRENKYGICYKNEQEFLNYQFVIAFLEYCSTNPQAANRIYNEFIHQKDLSPFFRSVLEVMKNVRNASNPKNIYYAKYLPYHELRALTLFIINNFSDIINYEDNIKAGEEHERKRIPIQYNFKK